VLPDVVGEGFENEVRKFGWRVLIAAQDQGTGRQTPAGRHAAFDICGEPGAGR
jgi:hypothetical protein